MATRKILFRGQTRHKGEKTSISGKPLPGIWVTGGIFPQNKGYERAIIYTQDPKVEKHVVYAETVGQYTGVDDVLETPVFEDDIITFWQRTDTKHMQRYKGIVKYDEALTSFTVVSCEPNRLSDPVFLWDCSDIHVVGNTFDGELSKREQEVMCTYTKCLALAKDIDYAGSYYTLTQSRVPYMYDKTSDESYYILTLFAIAKEFQAIGMIRPGQKAIKQDICLAMGLPPTHIHDLAPKYQTYFSREGRQVNFTYNDISFDIKVERVMVFPQGVAAIAPYMTKIMARPEAYTYIIDIGGYTTDVVKFARGGQVDMSFCESFNNGVIKMYDEVQRAVRNRYQLDMDDYSIDNILRRGYNPGKDINDLVHGTAQTYARTLIRTLKEKGVDLVLSYPVFIGGGSALMRPVIECELGRDDYLFIEDPRANAIGFRMMAESRLAAENR